MKQFFTFLTILGLGFSTWAAPTTTTTAPTDTTETEISLEDIQEELMNELDTVEITEDDETFFDQEIESKVAEKATEVKSAPKTATAKPAITPPTTKK